MSLSPITRVCLRRAPTITPKRLPTASAHGRSASTSTSTSTSTGTNNVRTILSLTALVAGSTVFTVYYLDSRSAIHRYVAVPLVRATMDPETGHKFAVKVLGSGLAPRDVEKDDPALRVEVGLN